MTSDNALNALFANEQELFLRNLGTYTIIDLGTISSVDSKGRAVVFTNQYIKGQRVIYQDVEVVYPGNTGGVYQASCSGSACLIFIPYTCVPDIQDQFIRVAARPYHKDGIKAMPIGNGSSCSVKQLFDTYGNLIITSKVHELLITEDTISLQQGKILNVTKAMDGSVYFYYKDEQSGPLECNINREGISRTYSSPDGSAVWYDSINKQGMRELILKNGNGDILFQITINPDGSFEQEQHYGEDKVNRIVLDSDGKLTIESSNNVVISSGDGNIEMNGNTKHLVKYEDLQIAMNKLYTALTTTNIVGNGSPQPTWTGIPTGIDISAAKTDTLLTGD